MASSASFISQKAERKSCTVNEKRSTQYNKYYDRSPLGWNAM